MRLPIDRLPRKLPLKLAGLVVGALVVAGAGFLAVSWNANASHAAANDPVVRPVRVMEIAYHVRGRSVVMAGTVVPRIETTLGFRVSGKIVQRAV
ncbi:MAG: hypothetical protein ACHQK9_14705, partial [Reyranellales bacterium]